MEYRKRCKVCGKIWCYTDEDLANDKLNNVTSAFNAIGGMASALGGTVFHNQYFADRMENDERKRVNRNQCPECRSLDSETISAEELENYKIQESFSKVQVSINSNATTESLLTRARLLLEDKDWASANAYCDNVLDTEPENGTAYLYKLMAELRVQCQEELKDKAEPFDGKANYQKVMRYADETITRTLSGYIEYIKNRNENERLQSVYVGASNRMRSATTAADFKAAAETFGTILAYKDAAALQKICLEKAEQTRIETEQKEAALKAKKTRNTIIIAVVLIVAAVAGYFAYSSSQKAAAYDEAIAFVEGGEYEAAIKAFTDLGDYKNCPELAEQISMEYERLAAVTMGGNITNEKIEEAKAVIEENKYVKDDEFAQSVYRFELVSKQLDNVEWMYSSGDVRTLSKHKLDNSERNTEWPTITTTINRDGNWRDYDYLGITSDELSVEFLHNAWKTHSQFHIDETTGDCKWVEQNYTAAEYIITLTGGDTLHVMANCTDGTTYECEYKRIG